MGIESFNFGAALTKAGVPTSGVFQKETATIVGTITGTGDATVVVTAAGMSGSPITLAVAVTSGDNAAAVATKIRAALNANAIIAAFFTIGGTGTDVTLTANVSAADDGTLNLAYDNDSCTGLTGDATSADTTAGVLGDYHGVASGQVVVDTTNNALYENTGDQYRPVWVLM